MISTGVIMGSQSLKMANLELINNLYKIIVIQKIRESRLHFAVQNV